MPLNLWCHAEVRDPVTHETRGCWNYVTYVSGNRLVFLCWQHARQFRRWRLAGGPPKPVAWFDGALGRWVP